jgi:hypothetical protein
LLLLRRGRKWGFEFKCADAPNDRKNYHPSAERSFANRTQNPSPGSAKRQTQIYPSVSVGFIPRVFHLLLHERILHL